MKSLLSNAELDSLAIEVGHPKWREDDHAALRFPRPLRLLSERTCTRSSCTMVCTYAFDGSVGVYAPPGIPLSRAGVGKNRALEITELLVPNPVVAVNVSPAYLFRKVGSEEGVTLLYDEIDTVFGPKARENEELRGLLNAGHRKGAVAGRCVVRGKNIETEEIPAYAAVAMAGLGWLPDTILSRSVIIRMRRRHAGESVEPYRRRVHAAEGYGIRDKIAAWTRSVSFEWPELPNEIQDRDADVWEPLIAIADAVGGEWPARARAAGVALVADSKEVEASLGIRSAGGPADDL